MKFYDKIYFGFKPGRAGIELKSYGWHKPRVGEKLKSLPGMSIMIRFTKKELQFYISYLDKIRKQYELEENNRRSREKRKGVDIHSDEEKK